MTDVAITISREELIQRAVDRVLGDFALKSVLEENIKRIMEDHAMIAVPEAAKMCGYDSVASFRRNHEDIIQKLTPKKHVVLMKHIKALTND